MASLGGAPPPAAPPPPPQLSLNKSARSLRSQGEAAATPAALGDKAKSAMSLTELADEALAESSTRHLQSELHKALERIDRQRVEIESLRGMRSVAVNVANEEAMRRGKMWGGEDVRRYSALQKAVVPPPSSPFHSDELREIMDQAIVAMTRRLTQAVKETTRARAERRRCASSTTCRRGSTRGAPPCSS